MILSEETNNWAKEYIKNTPWLKELVEIDWKEVEKRTVGKSIKGVLKELIKYRQ